MFTIDSINQLIQSKFSSFIKKGISINPHFVPLNLKLLERSLGGIIKNDTGKSFDFRRFRDSIHNYIRGKFQNTIILRNDIFLVNGKNNVLLGDLISKYTPALVFTNNNSKGNLVGVLFSSYQSAGAELLNADISQKIMSELSYVFSADSGVDLAYILREEENSTDGQKIKNFFGIFNSISQNTVNVANTNIPSNKAGVLQSKMMVESLLKDYAIYEERRLGTYSMSISKEVSNFVTSIKANIIILHDSKAKQEVKTILESSGIVDKISKMLPDLRVFKSSFIQDIKTKIRNTFLGKPNKASKESAKASSKISSTKINTKVTTAKGVNSEFIIPPAFISLTNLQNILNNNLFQEVKQHMGDGSRSDILNYRTGRLAKSFQVTGVSQDRGGALTAFFTYMKYPYATFAPGGVQGNPTTRNPVLLGEAAIRDIARDILKQRLRSVGI